jgi:hypothetical protein
MLEMSSMSLKSDQLLALLGLRYSFCGAMRSGERDIDGRTSLERPPSLRRKSQSEP